MKLRMASTVLISCFLCAFALEDIIYGESTQDMIEAGKIQYQILQEKGKNPKYGKCWQDSVKFLNDGCRALSEDTQSIVALQFTNCFLQMSGHEMYDCHEDEKPSIRAICINSMSDRAFNVYTEFYTHTQNMCFFLRNQMWLEETEHSIHMLSSQSNRVAQKLEETGEMQEKLLQQQKKSISLQSDLLEQGMSLTNILDESKNSMDHIMNEFRTSTLEQKRLLFDIFERLSALQSWVVGEVSWFDTLIFYIVAIIIATILTSPKRVSEARVLIYVILTINATVERLICNLIIENNPESYINSLSEDLNYYIWLCRKFFVFLCFLSLIITAYRYFDYHHINHQLLLNIKEQNSEIFERLEKLRNVRDKTPVNTTDYSLINENNTTPLTHRNTSNGDARSITARTSFANKLCSSLKELKGRESVERDTDTERIISSSRLSEDKEILSEKYNSYDKLISSKINGLLPSIDEEYDTDSNRSSTPKENKNYNKQSKISSRKKSERKPLSVVEPSYSKYNLRSSRQATPEI